MIYVLRTYIIELHGTFMKLSQATASHLLDLDQPVISDYEISILIFSLLTKKRFHGQKLEITDNDSSYSLQVKNVITSLKEFGIIEPHKDFPKGKVFRITGKKSYTAGDIVCAVDPFAYVSHISAMDFHGLTERIPKVLYVSSPSPHEWTESGRKKMEKDSKGHIKDYLREDLPRLTRILYQKIEKHPIIQYSSIHRGAFRKIEGRSMRVSTIGRTFLDMVREPDYCGGTRHVAEIFRDFGPQYKKIIIDEISRHGTKIEKARTGYYFEEICHIEDSSFDEWVSEAQRGGSRKLDPKNEFSPNFSERWCLSINVDLDGIV